MHPEGREFHQARLVFFKFIEPHSICIIFCKIYLTGMIDYNFLVLREAVDKVFELRNKSLKTLQLQHDQSEVA